MSRQAPTTLTVSSNAVTFSTAVTASFTTTTTVTFTQNVCTISQLPTSTWYVLPAGYCDA